MSKVTKAELNGYFSEISALLLCNEKHKKGFIMSLRNDIEAFLEENTEADINDIKAVFGSAEDISKGFMENTDPKTIAKRIKIKKYILAAVAVAVLIYALFVVFSLIDVHEEAHGYIEEGIMMIKIVTGGDFI